jgi:hypothetical protein
MKFKSGIEVLYMHSAYYILVFVCKYLNHHDTCVFKFHKTKVKEITN